MYMHAVHKILANASGKEFVKPGDFVNVNIDIAGINDIYLTVIKAFEEMEGFEVKYPDKIVFFFDHNAPCPTEAAAYNQKEMRDFAKKYDVKNIFEINKGVCHLVLPESGLVQPGKVVIITDSHTTTHGAFGAFGAGVGSTDLAVIMMTGQMWMRIPNAINVRLDGKLKDGVMAKDVALFLLRELGTKFALYNILEFSGEVIDALSVEERMVLCNMAVEMGAKTAYIQPDEKTVNYLRQYTDDEFTIFETDEGFEFEKEYEFDLSDLNPQVALPHSVDNVVDLADVEETNVNQVYIGSCTGGKFEDIEVAAKILKGHKVADGTRLIVTPASSEIVRKLIELGYYQSLLESGATFAAPGCGACFGGHGGILTDGEVCVSTTNRNFPGRMGSKGSSLYLVSPVIAAKTAIKGKLDNKDI